jgi:hypothetical protein
VQRRSALLLVKESQDVLVKIDKPQLFGVGPAARALESG